MDSPNNVPKELWDQLSNHQTQIRWKHISKSFKSCQRLYSWGIRLAPNLRGRPEFLPLSYKVLELSKKRPIRDHFLVSTNLQELHGVPQGSIYISQSQGPLQRSPKLLFWGDFQIFYRWISRTPNKNKSVLVPQVNSLLQHHFHHPNN